MPSAQGTTEPVAVPAERFVHWIAACLPGQCDNGTLTMSFANQDRREAWAINHERALRHRVWRYIQHSEYPPLVRRDDELRQSWVVPAVPRARLGASQPSGRRRGRAVRGVLRHWVAG